MEKKEMKRSERAMRLKKQALADIEKREAKEKARQKQVRERNARLNGGVSQRDSMEIITKMLHDQGMLNKYPDFHKYAITEHPEWFGRNIDEQIFSLKNEYRDQFYEKMKQFDIDMKNPANEQMEKRRELFQKNLVLHEGDDGTEFCPKCYERHEKGQTQSTETEEKLPAEYDSKIPVMASIKTALHKIIYGDDYQEPTDQQCSSSSSEKIENAVNDAETHHIKESDSEEESEGEIVDDETEGSE
uniref:Uncharacterized protein n=2 Tax=Caenorhabditis tropicalis TaxID=1561998 RepID=A0A1I7TZ30_9PELO